MTYSLKIVAYVTLLIKGLSLKNFNQQKRKYLFVLYYSHPL
jgi:hypothetical protein